MSGDRYFIRDQHQTYFITCTIVEWIDLFTRQHYKTIITDSLNYCIKEKGLRVNGWVLMTNHLHLLARCEKPHLMSDFLRDFKKFTSKRLAEVILTEPESRRDWLLDKFNFEARKTRRAEHFKIWRDDNHAIDMDHIDIMQKLSYIHDNPVRTMIVENQEDYLFSSARDYAGIKGLIEIEMI
ncbi:REP-associated tyrosine transposase [Daejeonella oryzae]|uniref:REP-associated tyrosine transposase n=1 Tax=Daejeonella oryzae TaxID=1122943 RepID=UPI000418E74E|nr:transposase [Daejeonella oryzae]